jgi:hypothetical protein
MTGTAAATPDLGAVKRRPYPPAIRAERAAGALHP